MNRIRFFQRPQPVRSFFRAIKYAYQRITRGYCDLDVWNIDMWFLDIIPDMLQQLKDTGHSTPCFLDDKDCPVEPKERWNSILDTMITNFHEANEDLCSRKNPYEAEWDRAVANKIPFEEYKEIRKKYAEEEKKIGEYRDLCKTEGLELFNRWFWELWD